MSDQIKEVSNISYGKNIKNSFAQVTTGFILFILSFVVLWLNEGSYVSSLHKADYINKNANPVSSEEIDHANDNKLISTYGKAETTETLSDGIISIPNALVLNRETEMYQWVEHVEESKKENIGGSTTVTKTYTYEKNWVNHGVDSSRFKDKTSHSNPPFILEWERINAQTGKLGAFEINETQTGDIIFLDIYKDLPKLPQYKISENQYYSSKDISNPQIGDIRISYKYLPSGVDLSIIGKQSPDNTIKPMQTKEGVIYIQYQEQLSQDEMVSKFKGNRKLFNNILRLLGFALMYFGLTMLVSPISVILKFIPALSWIAEILSNFVMFLLAAILSIVTIAIAWFAYRPLLSICLIAVACIIVVVIKNKSKIKLKTKEKNDLETEKEQL